MSEEGWITGLNMDFHLCTGMRAESFVYDFYREHMQTKRAH